MLIDTLDLYKRYPEIQGTRRFKWKLQVLNPRRWSDSIKIPPQGFTSSTIALSETIQTEPLPLFHALLMILVDHRRICRNPSNSSTSHHTLQSAFTATDNPYLASTLYQCEGSENFSALDRLNYLWYLMFSGFAFDNNHWLNSIAPPADLAVSQPEDQMTKSELDQKDVTISDSSNPNFTPIHSAECEDISVSSKQAYQDIGLTTLTEEPPEVVPKKSKHQLRMEYSRDRFLDNLPNPNTIYDGRPKS
jgi:hypothetical protein